MSNLIKFDYILSFEIFDYIEPGKSSEVDGARYVHQVLKENLKNKKVPDTLNEALNMISHEISIILGCDFNDLTSKGISSHEKLGDICSNHISRLLRNEFISMFTLHFQCFKLIEWQVFDKSNSSVFDKILIDDGANYLVKDKLKEDEAGRIILCGSYKDVELQPLSYSVMLGDCSVTIEAAMISDDGSISAYQIKNRDSEVLTKNLEWIDHITPSNRTKEYTSKCYFGSLQLAKECILRLMMSGNHDRLGLISRNIKLPKKINVKNQKP